MSAARATILVVEDDEAIADGLALNLRLEGFTPHTVHDGKAALRATREQQPDLILLDITLPEMDGLEVLTALRQEGDMTPIIVLSARQNEYDKVAALRLGADDYVTKPFGVAELLARVDSVLRRSGPPPTGGASPLRFSGVIVDPERREVTRDGQPVALTHLEFELLTFLMQNASKVFSRDTLLRTVWGVHHSGSPRTVDNFIAQLRTKLEEDPNRPRHILTVRGSGYRFDP